VVDDRRPTYKSYPLTKVINLTLRCYYFTGRYNLIYMLLKYHDLTNLMLPYYDDIYLLAILHYIDKTYIHIVISLVRIEELNDYTIHRRDTLDKNIDTITILISPTTRIKRI
jgi:hypothetical protein